MKKVHGGLQWQRKKHSSYTLNGNWGQELHVCDVKAALGIGSAAR